MADTDPQSMDIRATLTLEQLRESLDRAMQQFPGDPLLRRAFIQAAGAIDTRLGRPKEFLNRKSRRSGPR
jgi:hypothetical protein